MTPRLHISLIAPGVQSLALTQRILTYLMVCCLGLTGGLWWYGQELDQQTSSLQTQIGILNQTNQQLMIKADSL